MNGHLLASAIQAITIASVATVVLLVFALLTLAVYLHLFRRHRNLPALLALCSAMGVLAVAVIYGILFLMQSVGVL